MKDCQEFKSWIDRNNAVVAIDDEKAVVRPKVFLEDRATSR